MKRLMLIVLAALAITLPSNRGLAQSESGSGSYIVQGSSTINARSCPHLNCGVITTFAPGDTVQVLDTVHGDTVSGSDLWRHTTFEGTDVYVHSSLVSPVNTGESTNGKGHAENLKAVSTAGWVRHENTGMSIKSPPGWIDFSGDEDVVRLLVKGFQRMEGEQSSTAALSARFANALILTEPLTSASFAVYSFYDGRETPLVMMQLRITENLKKAGFTFVEASLLDLPSGKALRVYYGDFSSGTTTYPNEYLWYYLYQDRVMYRIEIGSPQAMSEDLFAVYETMVKSLTITSPEAMRRALSDDAGSAQLGENTGDTEYGQCDLWTYDGQAGEALSISVKTVKSVLRGPDTYVIIRAPNGEIIAENDDASSSDPNPYIELKLPVAGKYEIEIHTYPGFKTGTYTLVIAAGSTKDAIKNQA